MRPKNLLNVLWRIVASGVRYYVAGFDLAMCPGKVEKAFEEAEALKDNPALIQLRIAEKWDGQLPQVSGGDAIPLLNIDAMRASYTRAKKTCLEGRNYSVN